MKIKFIVVFFLVFLVSYNLSAFTQQKCMKCHKKSKIVSGKYSHKPVKDMKCLSCHRAHASKFDNLLNKPINKLCKECHKKLFKEAEKAKFLHPPFKENACIRCHNSHSSDFKSLLKEPSNKLCVKCHKNLTTSYKFKHAPFKNGKCLSCHTDHFSNDMRFIKEKGAKICIKCHKIDVNLRKKHKEKFVSYNCLTCHNPHGENNRALLRKVNHKPFAEGKCNKCHNKNSKNRDLCLNCHKNILKSFDRVHNHLLGGVENNPCLICHDPHVGNTKSLLKDSSGRLCQRCHFETYKQKMSSLYIHPDWDKCINCHDGHGENNVAMLKGGGNNSCAKCHESHAKFTHPIGEKVKDPRNGQELTCITCHDPMGTNFKYNLRLSGEGELCLECHKNY